MIGFVQMQTMGSKNAARVEGTKLHAKLHTNQRCNTCLRPVLRGEAVHSRALCQVLQQPFTLL